MVALLDEPADVGYTGRPQQLPQFGELVVAAVGGRRDQVRPLTSAPGGAMSVGRGPAYASVAAALHPG
jgi:hypothetical protein